MYPRTMLFITGFSQVCLVGINTWQISHQKWVGCMVVGFFISLLWSFNVKKIAFGTHTDRCVYAVGAALGTLAGLAAATLFYEYLWI